MNVDAPSGDGFLVSDVRKHEWADSMLQELINWERACVEPRPEDLHTYRCKTLTVQQGEQLAYSSMPPPESGW